MRADLISRLRRLKADFSDLTSVALYVMSEEGWDAEEPEQGSEDEGKPAQPPKRTIKPGTFVKASLETLYDMRISDGAFRLYLHIQDLSGTSGKFWESRSNTAGLLGVSAKTIQRWIGELVKAGYLKPLSTT